MAYVLKYEMFESKDASFYDNVDLSKYSKKVYYHGTTKSNAENIRKIGFYPEHNVNIIDDYDEALEYATELADDENDYNENENETPEVIEVLLKKGAKPKAEDGIDYWAYDAKYVIPKPKN